MLFKTHDNICLNRLKGFIDRIFKSVPDYIPARSFFVGSCKRRISIARGVAVLGVLSFVLFFVLFLALLLPFQIGDRDIVISHYDLKDDVLKRNEALLGLESEQVLRLFDAPELVRSDVPVSLWQYRSDDCVLDLFLGDDGRNTAERVIHSEARPRDPSEETIGWRDCVSALLDAKGYNDFALLFAE